jgi:uncharacterized protein YbjQ (UPF0145 family)
MGNNDHEDDDRKDLTRIEDLSEFLHESNPEIESKLNSFNSETPNIDFTSTNIESGVDVSGLEDVPSLPDMPVEAPPEETPVEDLFSTENFTEGAPPDVDFTSENNEESFPQFPDEAESVDFSSSDTMGDFNSTEVNDQPIEEMIQDEPQNSLEELQDFSFSSEQDSEQEILDQNEPIESFTDTNEAEDISPSYSTMSEISSNFQEPEKFEEVKTFAHTFSYGQVSVGGNPPFSIIVRNIKYKEDAESIFSLLKEFGIVTDKNLNETKIALDIGSLLIPQISEFAAIVLAHKFRRFDCDIEFGLSEEIHPTKAGESYNKGLSSKESIRQNKIDTFKKSSPKLDINDIFVSTTSSLEGYEIVQYLGVHSSLAIIEAEELERLKFVQSTQRTKSPVFSTEKDEADSMTTEEAFDDYQKSFDGLFIDLVDQLKQKAFKENANALLGLNYQMSQLPLNSKDKKQLSFQLVCSATLALVKQK